MYSCELVKTVSTVQGVVALDFHPNVSVLAKDTVPFLSTLMTWVFIRPSVSFLLAGRPLNTYQPSKSPKHLYRPSAVFTHTEDYGELENTAVHTFGARCVHGGRGGGRG